MKHEPPTQVNDLLESSPDHRFDDTLPDRTFPARSGQTLQGALGRLLQARLRAPFACFGLQADGQGRPLRLSDKRAPGARVLSTDAGPAASGR